MKLEKEGLKQPFHNLMLKTGLGKLRQIISESEQLFAFGVKKISALCNLWIFSEQPSDEGYLFSVNSMRQIM